MVEAIITARKGSKRIPGKNKKIFCGKPLIVWTIEAAINSSYVEKVYVSTDSEEIAEISRSAGALVPGLRPEYLSNDEATSLDVILFFKKYLNKTDLLLLQPTSPLRNFKDIDNFMIFVKEQNCNQCVAVKDITKNLKITFKVENDFLKKFNSENNQYLMPNGSMYFTTFEALERYKSFVSETCRFFKMSEASSIDIDTSEDWDLAEAFMRNNLAKKN